MVAPAPGCFQKVSGKLLTHGSDVSILPRQPPRGGWSNTGALLPEKPQMIRRKLLTATAVGASLLAVGAPSASADVTTFDNGTEGWSVSGRDNISQTGGNPGANMDVEVLDVFGISIRNDSNGAFLGDFSRFGSQGELSVDVKINSVWMFDLDGNPFEVPRNLVVELVDYHDDPENPYPYTSVWFNFGEIGADLPGWRNFSITVDPNATE